MSEIWLRGREGPAGEAEVAVGEDELTLGREPAAGVTVDDPGVSREHARLWVQGDTVVVEDLGSSNGTFVNGEEISTATRLGAGDVLQIGSTSFEIDLGTAETSVLSSSPATEEAQPPAQPRRPPPPRPAPVPAAEPEPAAGAGRGGIGWQAIAAAVLGPISILLLVFGAGVLFYASLPVAIAAIVLGSVGKRQPDRSTGSRSLAITGQIFGIVGVILSTIAILVLIAVSVATDVARDNLDNLSGLVDEVRTEIESEVDSRTQ